MVIYNCDTLTPKSECGDSQTGEKGTSPMSAKRRHSRFASIFPRHHRKKGRHQSFTHRKRKISVDGANTAEIASRVGSLFKWKKLIVGNLLTNPTVEDTIRSVTESGNDQLIGTEDDQGIIARDPKAAKGHGRSLSMRCTLRTIHSKQDPKAIRKGILFPIPSRALETGSDMHDCPAEDGSIATVTMSAIHEYGKLQRVVGPTVSSADTYQSRSSISGLLHQENEKHNMTMDSAQSKIMEGLHPLSQQVEDLIGTIRSNKSLQMDYPLCDVVESSDLQVVETITLYPINAVDWDNTEHQPAPILAYEEPIDQEKVSDKTRESKMLSIETVSEKPLLSAEVMACEQCSFATEPSRISSPTDEFTHSYIEDTLDAINAYLQSDEHATDPALSELESFVEEVSVNVSNPTSSGNFQKMFDISDVSDITSAESYGIFQNEANDSVVGIMTTFVRYMLSGSEDRRSTKVQGSFGSSIVVDNTNVDLFNRSLMTPCHNVDLPEKYEPLVHNMLKDSWGYISSYLPGGMPRISSPTSWQGDDVDQRPSQLRSENFYDSAKYSPMKQIQPGAFPTSGSNMIKGLASAFIPLRSQAVNTQMDPYTDERRYGIQNHGHH
ncbi:hypothetical protein V1520DRAFT_340830 [Lipomyces starkeyi]